MIEPDDVKETKIKAIKKLISDLTKKVPVLKFKDKRKFSKIRNAIKNNSK